MRSAARSLPPSSSPGSPPLRAAPSPTAGCCASPGAPAASRARHGAERPLSICLAGNPNVGKSRLFNRLTGATAEVANYAGMTVAPQAVETSWHGREVEVTDLPGAYSVGAGGEQALAWDHLLAARPDVVVAVVDAGNLARSLYLVLQLLDLELTVVVAANLVDLARKRMPGIDLEALQAELGVPVVPTSAATGEGVAALKDVVLEVAARAPAEPGAPAGDTRRYSHHVEARREALAKRLAPQSDAPRLSPRAAALIALEGEDGQHDGRPMGLSLRIASERHAAAQALACAAAPARPEPAEASRLWRLATSPATGLPLMVVVLAAVLATLFLVGDLLSSLLTSAWAATLGPASAAGVHAVLGHTTVAAIALWGINGAMLATLAVGIPYVLTFSLILAALEDSGYMSAAAYLSDRTMRRLGLHGQAVIPLIAAAGCNVPAILGTRVLSTMRERMIACVLITLTPCSARTAVILGAVALYAGWQWAVFVYIVVGAVGISAALILDRLLPGEPGPFIMEMFPLRWPSLRLIGAKAWRRFAEFTWVAAPIVVGGSLALGALYETGLVWYLTKPLEPVVGWWLGLPAVAGLTLIFAVLRKELALQLLVVFAVAAYGAQAHTLSHFMSPHQLVVYGLVNAIYVPCVATIAALARELGRPRAALISAGTVGVALAVGGAAAHLLPLL